MIEAPPGGDLMIRAMKLSKRYPGGTTALEDVDIEVGRGEFVFITGASGAGKTTLLRLILRQELPSSGQVLVNGRNVGALPASKVPDLRKSIGVVFQDFKLIQRKTALRAFQVLRSVGLHHRLGVLPPALSGGEQQRVAIARAVVNEPTLLLADEPTGNLDPDLAVEIMRLFREINARGTTVVVSTHYRDLVKRMQRRVVTLERGHLAPTESKS
jgi:cell division transport system ATP-binding protein